MNKLALATIGLVFILSSSCENKTTPDKTETTESNTVEEEIRFINFEGKYDDYKTFSDESNEELLTNIASYIIRKPAAATWETKFNQEFREYYERNKSELELVFLTTINERTHFFLLREARTVDGIAQRGVAGSFIFDAENNLTDFEEILVTKVLPEIKLKEIGLEYMELVSTNSSIQELLNRTEHIEWPDGRLFYSKQKAEWRYVD